MTAADTSRTLATTATEGDQREALTPSAPTVAQMTDVLVYHCRIGSRTCRECGDLPLGSSFAQHQAEQIAALGVTS